MIQLSRYRRLISAVMLAAMSGFFPAAAADDGRLTELPPPLGMAVPVPAPVAKAAPPAPIPITADDAGMPPAASSALPAPAPTLNTMRFITLGRVHFATAKWQLDEGAKQTLDKAAEYLAAHPGASRLLLGGHTDWVGGTTYNDVLSEKRAESVKAYLATKGVNPELLHSKAHGKRMPVDENWSSHGRGRNRQVELYAVYLPR